MSDDWKKENLTFLDPSKKDREVLNRAIKLKKIQVEKRKRGRKAMGISSGVTAIATVVIVSFFSEGASFLSFVFTFTLIFLLVEGTILVFVTSSLDRWAKRRENEL